jgi:hypothetical protein
VQGRQTDFLTSISARSIEWAVILVLIYVDTFTTDVIVFISIVMISPSDIVTVDLTEWYCYLWSHRVILLPLISPSDIVSSNEPSLILKIIGQCNFVCIMTILIKTITSVVKVSVRSKVTISLCEIKGNNITQWDQR